MNCGLLELLECWKQQLTGFQHFNDFNDSQEGNAVQDSPSLPMVMTKGRLKMKTSNQLAMYRESLVKYALKYGVTKTAIKYNTNRQYVYRWKTAITALQRACLIVLTALTLSLMLIQKVK